MEDFSADDQPWTEAQWDTFMKRQEVRSARVAELLESTMGRPDQWEIVAREMGWEEAPDSEDAWDDEDDAGVTGFDPAAEWLEEMEEEEECWAAGDEAAEAAFFDDAGSDGAPERQIRREEIEQIPAYRLAYDAGLAVHDALQPFVRLHEEEDDELARRLGETVENALIPAAKISGGHAMGYDDDVLCGNIICCRRALDAAAACERSLGELADENLLPRDLADRLQGRLRGVTGAIQARIDDLRARVWWE